MHNFQKDKSNNNFIFQNILFIVVIIICVFFSRFFVNLGAPTIFNHVHYLITIFFFLVYLPRTSSQTEPLIIYCIILFVILLISSFLNETSLLNLIVFFAIIFQPFLIILTILKSKINKFDIEKIKNLLILIAILNTMIAYYQFFVENLRKDYVTGLFFSLGTGAHAAAIYNSLISLSLIFEKKNFFNLKKLILSFIFLSVIFLSSANQIILIFTISILIYFIYNLIIHPNKKNFIKLFLLIVLSMLIFQLFKQTDDYKNISNSIKYADDIWAALIIKYSVFSNISVFFNDYANYLFGLGPGHGISRLAYEMEKFPSINFSKTEVSSIIYFIQERNWLNNHITGSSIFTLNFFASGIYSELGLVGLTTYLLIWFYFFKKLRENKVCFFYIIIAIIFMFVYRWQEEPMFVVYISTYIGISLKELIIQNDKIS